jgi:hypothetical protein
MLAALTFTSSFAIAITPFNCGTLSASQAETYEKEMSSDSLKDLAKTCDEQAQTFQNIAQQAQAHLTSAEVTDLYAKAANAQLYVANFTNTALFK